MTIIHLSSSLGGGGAEQMVLQLSRQSNATIKTIVISVSSVNTLEQQFKKHNIECQFLNINSFKNSSLTKGLTKLHQIINSQNKVVFHCHQYHGFLLGFLYNLKYRIKTPIIFTLHSSTIEHFNRKLILFSTKLFRKKDIIFSENAKKWYLKNSEIIPNGIDFDALTISDDRVYNKEVPFTFLFLGRLSQEKNPVFLISAAKQLIANGITNFKINFVGDGHLKTELSNIIKKQNLESYFILSGFQNDIKPFIDNANCLVLPSNWEGLPVVIIEAAAAKLPIIATPVGSIPDFLNQNNAFVSNLDNFHQSMISAITNYNAATIKSQKLYDDIKSIFNIESVYNKHLKLYKSLL